MKFLPLDSFPFQSRSHLSLALTYTLQIEALVRHLDVFRWEDRLVAYEEENDLWWCTFDICGSQDAHEFWHECVDDGRVGRLYAVERAFLRASPPGATLELGPYRLYVVVAQDNSGIARAHNEKVWHSFPAGKVKGIRKPLATTPTVWSRRFHAKFAMRSLDAVGVKFEEDVMVWASQPIRELWSQGASALPIRLVAAALAFGWANSLRGRPRLTMYEFWKAVLSSRPHFSATSQKLPGGLLHCPEVDLPGHVIISGFTYPGGKPPAVFVWKQANAILRVEFRSRNESAHELMEHRLELRDWLEQFFSRSEVEALFSS